MTEINPIIITESDDGIVHGSVSNGIRTISFKCTPSQIAFARDENLNLVTAIINAAVIELEQHPDDDGDFEISVGPVMNA
jgi:hypothetical protein